ncbi:ABC transporter ATP-binding protein [Desulfovibrio ferrophilus]|uniref:ABC transporter n=1 Tax=Desulfovibrio ferrophilus TaxID=241368 RepID=A0A2Z6AZA5_9BACT|nr:ABC transporter ATP-binding protein [Desulfovibrio ferrophilus]BBD08594.1 ABC transporter [Desulfovibrio ferrophilus]
MYTPKPALRLSNITKRFGSLVANDAISLELGKGEMLALLGENGAGKTTLMNVLFGHYVPDDGRVEIHGNVIPQGSPREALHAGVGMVHQHFTLGENMSVLENIILGTEPTLSLSLETGAARKRLAELMEQFGLTVTPDALVRDLSVGQRQRVEILKALFRDTSVLILDEPTAVLTPQESDKLFETLRLLVDKGLSVIFITHKLREVMAASDRCVVLRHGKVVLTTPTAETDAETLARAMVGGEVPKTERVPSLTGKELLRIDGVTVQSPEGRALLDNLNLSLHAGEILGIAGVSGNGQAQLADLISGLTPPDSGSIAVNGKTIARPTPAGMVAMGVGRIPEDRTGTGLIGDMTVQENLGSEVYRNKEFSRFGFLNFKSLRRRAKELIERFDVRCPGPGAATRKLSGGNMQKLILARVLSGKPSVILASQPTWGLDVGAAAFVHRCLMEAAERGAGVLLISEDLDELFQVTDRIQVMHCGRLSTPVRPGEVDAAQLGLAMSGHRAAPHTSDTIHSASATTGETLQ